MSSPNTSLRPGGPNGGTLRFFIEAVEVDGPLTLDRWTGKRHRARRALIVPVSIHPIPETRLHPAELCKLRDITDCSIGIRSQRPYAVDNTVRVELVVNNAAWNGEMQVVHCTQTIGGYKVGLRLPYVADPPTSGLRPPEADCEPETAVVPDPTAQLRKTLRERGSLEQAASEIQEAMRAYNLARRTWGLLGVSVRREIHRVIGALGLSVRSAPDARRKHARMQASLDVQVLLRDGMHWRRLPAQIADVSENGIGLTIPYDLTDDAVERELAGDLTIHTGMTVILGLNGSPHTLWVPAEIVHAQHPIDNLIRIGARFATPHSLDAFSK